MSLARIQKKSVFIYPLLNLLTLLNPQIRHGLTIVNFLRPIREAANLLTLRAYRVIKLPTAHPRAIASLNSPINYT